MKLGADPMTLMGLAGLGDLVATCSSPLSRNRTFGEKLGQGMTTEEIVASTRQVAEGAKSCASILDLATSRRRRRPRRRARRRGRRRRGGPAPDMMYAFIARDTKHETRLIGASACSAARPSSWQGTMARMSLPTPTLHTARLRLRPFTDADADALFALHSSAHVLRYWDAPPWSERARAERFIAACRQMAEEGTGARLAMDRVSDGAFIGWCSLTRWNPDYRSASMGYCLDDAAWGHGYATEAARALLQWAFDTLDLNRVQAETDTRNVASARVLEKLGFVREGTLREDCVVNGEVSDSWVYGLLRREWRPSSEPDPGR